MNPKELRDAALALTPAERARLAHDLLCSLDAPAELGAEKAWIGEIEKRARELEDGSVTPVDWSEARKRIMRRLNSRGA
jgi:putative addiction module component (TIGR02574 family)